MHIDDIFKTRKGPGISVRGMPNALSEAVFRELTAKLREFYAQRNHVYKVPEYRRGERSYETPVYNLEGVELLVHQGKDESGHVRHRDSHTETKPVLSVKIIEQRKDTKTSYTPRSDFPERAHIAEISRFLVYFNTGNKLGMQHRDDFFDYFKRMSVH